MDEQKIVKESILEVFNKNGYGDLSRMTQRDFDHVGDEIEKKTGILISGTTIKRLAYGEFSRLPQIATLNAIARYFDHKTWQDFKSSRTEEESIKETVPQVKKKGRGLSYLYVLSGLVILASIYFLASPRPVISNLEKASFSFRKSTSNDIPNTVVFNYNIDDVQADSFFIQQSWDVNRAVRIYKNKYTLTDIYYEPGYHVAKLLANDSVIRTVDVSIPTDRWFLYSIDNIARYTPEYIKTDSYINNGSLCLTVPQLKENSIDITLDKRYHYVYFPTQMDVSSENFKLRTRVRMKEVRNSFCPYIELEVFCQRHFMTMRSTTPGCSNQVLVQFGERVIRGTDADLAPVTFDVHQWTEIEITVKNKIATIKVNDKEVFSTQYVSSTKNITGFAYISNGLCEVDWVELVGLDGQIVYKNEF